MVNDTVMVSCSNCGATFAIPKGVSSVKCPYCGYTLTLFNQEILGFPVYMLPLKVPKGKVIQVLLEEMDKQVGVDDEFEREVARGKVELLLVPFIVFDSNSRAVFSYKGRYGDVSYLGEVAVPLNGWFTILTGVPIPPAGRVPLDAGLVESSIVIPLEFNVKAIKPEVRVEEREMKVPFFGTVKRKIVIIDTGDCGVFTSVGKCYDPKKEAEKVVREKLNELLLARGSPPVREYQISLQPVMVVYVPIYLITYGKKHAALINGSSGDVIIATYEQEGSYRTKALGIAGATIAAGLLSYLAVGIAGPAVGIVASLPFFWRAISKVQAFGTKGSILKLGELNKVLVKVSEVKKGGN